MPKDPVPFIIAFIALFFAGICIYSCIMNKATHRKAILELILGAFWLSLSVMNLNPGTFATTLSLAAGIIITLTGTAELIIVKVNINEVSGKRDDSNPDSSDAPPE